jgi:hypothetical protein
VEEEFGVDFCLTYECLRSNFSEFRAALGKGWRFGLPRRVSVTGLSRRKSRRGSARWTICRGFQVFEQLVQGPAPLYTKIVKVPAGSHRLEVSVKDMTTGKLAADTIDFEVK